MLDSPIAPQAGRLSLTRLSLTPLSAPIADPAIDHELIQGFQQSPKTIPARYFYDERGSQLFEQICDLPEYYLTRTETAIFQTCADELAALTGPCDLIELGSGSSTKTRLLLDAYQRLPRSEMPWRYGPIDVSPTILTLSAQELLQAYPELQIEGRIGTYDQALTDLQQHHTSGQRRLIAFIGSSLGNFGPAGCDRLLGQISQALQPGDYFLLGVDLRQSATKSVAMLEAAYDDAQGVTAAFNRNMLQHLNDRYGSNFDLNQFEHQAHYNSIAHQIEMHLRSRIAQTVTLPALDLTLDFAAGETILSEISRKFDPTALHIQLTQQQLLPQKLWTDAQQWFGVMLCRKA
jgi:L-histidine Nalpha-methyltransferase